MDRDGGGDVIRKRSKDKVIERGRAKSIRCLSPIVAVATLGSHGILSDEHALFWNIFIQAVVILDLETKW